MTFGSSMSHPSSKTRISALEKLKQSNAAKLELETRKMEERIRSLKEKMIKEKEERERLGGTIWTSGRPGPLAKPIQKPFALKKTSSNRSVSKAPKKIKVLSDEPIDNYMRKQKPKHINDNKINYCGQCEKNSSIWYCNECSEKYCDTCFNQFHQKGALKKHTKTRVEKEHVSKTEKQRSSPRSPRVDNDSLTRLYGEATDEPSRENRRKNGESLLNGSYNEEESAASFAQALKEWRNQGQVTKRSPRNDLICTDTSCGTSSESVSDADNKKEVKITFHSSMTYGDRLFLKKGREDQSVDKTAPMEVRNKQENTNRPADHLTDRSTRSEEKENRESVNDFTPNYREMIQSMTTTTTKTNEDGHIPSQHTVSIREISPVECNSDDDKEITCIIEENEDETNENKTRPTTQHGPLSILEMSSSGDFCEPRSVTAVDHCVDSLDSPRYVSSSISSKPFILMPKRQSTRANSAGRRPSSKKSAKKGQKMKPSQIPVDQAWKPKPSHKELSEFFLAGVKEDSESSKSAENSIDDIKRSSSSTTTLSQGCLSTTWHPQHSYPQTSPDVVDKPCSMETSQSCHVEPRNQSYPVETSQTYSLETSHSHPVEPVRQSYSVETNQSYSVETSQSHPVEPIRQSYPVETSQSHSVEPIRQSYPVETSQSHPVEPIRQSYPVETSQSHPVEPIRQSHPVETSQSHPVEPIRQSYPVETSQSHPVEPIRQSYPVETSQSHPVEPIRQSYPVETSQSHPVEPIRQSYPVETSQSHPVEPIRQSHPVETSQSHPVEPIRQSYPVETSQSHPVEPIRQSYPVETSQSHPVEPIRQSYPVETSQSHPVEPIRQSYPVETSQSHPVEPIRQSYPVETSQSHPVEPIRQSYPVETSQSHPVEPIRQSYPVETSQSHPVEPIRQSHPVETSQSHSVEPIRQSYPVETSQSHSVEPIRQSYPVETSQSHPVEPIRQSYPVETSQSHSVEPIRQSYPVETSRSHSVEPIRQSYPVETSQSHPVEPIRQSHPVETSQSYSVEPISQSDGGLSEKDCGKDTYQRVVELPGESDDLQLLTDNSTSFHDPSVTLTFRECAKHDNAEDEELNIQTEAVDDFGTGNQDDDDLATLNDLAWELTSSTGRLTRCEQDIIDLDRSDDGDSIEDKEFGSGLTSPYTLERSPTFHESIMDDFEEMERKIMDEEF